MSHIDSNKRSLGITFTPEQEAQVRLWAPSAKQVTLALNAHHLPLTKNEAGYWWAKTDQIKPGDLYTFVLDNEKECADPASLAQPQGTYGPSQAIDTNAFYWEDSCWINPPFDEYVVYELDIHSFTPEGTLKAILKKLGHLKKVGINAIVIRPLAPFPDSPNDCYTTEFLYAVQASYGGPQQLQQLINACHYEGIAVIIDMVCTPPNQPFNSLRDFGAYYPRKQNTSAGKTPVNKPAQQEAWQHHLIENILMWFRDFHVDAIHLDDAVQGLPDDVQLLQAIRTYTNTLTRQTGRQHYLLVEHEVPQMLVRENISQSFSVNNGTNGYVVKAYQKEYVYDSRFASVLHEFFNRGGETILGEPEPFILSKVYSGQPSLAA